MPRQGHPAMNLCLLLLCPCVAAGTRSSAQDLQPDRIDVGVVHVGATVEVSGFVFWGNPTARDVKPEITMPEFATLASTNTAVRQNHKGAGPSDYTDLVVTINTDRVGEFEGRMLNMPVRP